MTLRNILLAACLLSLFVAAVPLSAVTISIHTNAAEAVLTALQNPDLNQEQALRIAGLFGNRGIIRKMNEFGIPATANSFARALLAAAHDVTVTQPEETIFDFASLRPRAGKLLKLVNEIEDDPEAFRFPVELGASLYALPDINIEFQGYIVAGGDGGGYAFGEPSFFVNIAAEAELDVAKVVATHELYHAIQGALSADRKELGSSRLSRNRRQKACADTFQLFADIYREGSAQYVENFAALAESLGPSARKMYTDRANGLAHVAESVTLLELSVIGLNARAPVAYDDVYAVGFHGQQGVLYTIGFVMARAIVDAEGPQGLAKRLGRTGYEFVAGYTTLSSYGMDADHPKLGPNTTARLSQRGCQ